MRRLLVHGAVFLGLVALLFLWQGVLRWGGRSVAPTADGPSSGAPVAPAEAPMAGDVSPRTADVPVETRLVALFRDRYDVWMLRFYRAGRGSLESFRELVEDGDVLALASSIRELKAADPAIVERLRAFCERSKSQFGQFVLLALVSGGHPELESWLAARVSGAEAGLDRAIAAWGLARIGSETAVATIAERLRAGKPDSLLASALGSIGPAALDIFLKMAEEGVESEGPLFFHCRGDAASPRLRELATTHAIPRVRLWALQALLDYRRPADFEFALLRQAAETDPAIREKLDRQMLGSTLMAPALPALGDEAKSVMNAFLAKQHPGIQSRMLLRVDPERGIAQVRETLMGQAPTAERLRSIYAMELVDLKRADSSALLEEFALSATGMDLVDGALPALMRAGSISDPRLVERLLELAANPRPFDSSAKQERVLETLSRAPESARPAIAARLERTYADSASPVARVSILEGLHRFGDAGRAILVREASESRDPAIRLAALASLSKTPGFGRDAKLVALARAVLVEAEGFGPGWPLDDQSHMIWRHATLSQRVMIAERNAMTAEELRRAASSSRIPFPSRGERNKREAEETIMNAAASGIDMRELER